MAEYHNTTINFTGAGCRARCTARGCNWMGRNHLAIPNVAFAWDRAQTEGRQHTAEARRMGR